MNNAATPSPHSPTAGFTESSDELLIQRSQAGDTSAFDELVTRYRGKVYAMTLNLVRNEADALDLAQETFIRAWRALPRFEARSGFYTWIFRICHNLCYDKMRSKKVEGSGEFDDSRGLPEIASDAKLPYSADRPDRALSRQETYARLHAAIGKLSDEHRTAILLKEMEGLSYQEIADTVGCSIGTVMSRLFYARKQLQVMLKDEKFQTDS